MTIGQTTPGRTRRKSPFHRHWSKYSIISLMRIAHVEKAGASGLPSGIRSFA